MEGRGFLRGGGRAIAEGRRRLHQIRLGVGEGIEFHGRSGGGMRDGGPSVQEREAAAIPPFFFLRRSPAS